MNKYEHRSEQHLIMAWVNTELQYNIRLVIQNCGVGCIFASLKLRIKSIRHMSVLVHNSLLTQLSAAIPPALCHKFHFVLAEFASALILAVRLDL